VRKLPPYNHEWSDSCTIAPLIPRRLRKRFQMWMVSAISDEDVAVALHLACVRHDAAYYYGGRKWERLAADQHFRDDLRQAGAPFWFWNAAYRAVRLWGGPKWQQQGVSWGYGGSFFDYGYRALPLLEIGLPGAAEASELLYTAVPADPGALFVITGDLWPFVEPRCDCPDSTLVLPWCDDFDEGMFCGGCGETFTRRRLE